MAAILIMGCSTTGECKTQQYTIKEKFSEIEQCGFGSAENYNILTTSGLVFTIANGCYAANGYVGMEQYGVWYDATKNSSITRTCNGKWILT